MAKKTTQNKRVTTQGTKSPQKRTSRTPAAPVSVAFEVVKKKRGTPKLKGPVAVKEGKLEHHSPAPAKKRGRPAKSEDKPKKPVTTSTALIQYTGVSASGKQKVLTVGKGDKVNSICSTVRWDLWLCIP